MIKLKDFTGRIIRVETAKMFSKQIKTSNPVLLK
jgi:hypothetical protein